ncbi:UPF0073 membrane protein [Dictyocoela roeselum]|nr:UPF0073 membrane protein [Dictyocoela roeselum]
MTKPFFRGKIHLLAFILTLMLAFAYTILSIKHGQNTPITVYLTSQLILFGTSTLYHNIAWSKRIHRIIRKIDHASIFILISGTQTCISLLTFSDSPAISSFLVLTWSISFAGICEVLFYRHIPLLNVAIYICHGLCCVPFIKYVKANVCLFDLGLYVLGGCFYILGGLVYAMEWPDPNPKVFGYHEVFHLLTVCGNLGFLVPVGIMYGKILRG